MSNQECYQYIGTIRPGENSSRFTLSVFNRPDDKEKYYYQKVDKGKIKAFKEINVDEKQLLYVDEEEVLYNKKQPIMACVEDEIVLSFVNNAKPKSNKLIYGQGDEIDKAIVPLISEEDLNVYSRLEISEHLELYNKTFELRCMLNANYNRWEFNKELKKKRNPLKEFDVADIVNRVEQRYEILAGHNPDIVLIDVVYMDKDAIYFNDFQIATDMFFEDDMLDADPHFCEVISKLICQSLEVQSVHLKEAIGKDALYQFILRSELVELSDETMEECAEDGQIDFPMEDAHKEPEAVSEIGTAASAETTPDSACMKVRKDPMADMDEGKASEADDRLGNEGAMSELDYDEELNEEDSLVMRFANKKRKGIRSESYQLAY